MTLSAIIIEIKREMKYKTTELPKDFFYKLYRQVLRRRKDEQFHRYMQN